jgi:hypothetical protein
LQLSSSAAHFFVRSHATIVALGAGQEQHIISLAPFVPDIAVHRISNALAELAPFVAGQEWLQHPLAARSNLIDALAKADL